jgi:hypothetical protein
MSGNIRRTWPTVLAVLVLVALLPAANVAAWNDYCNDTTRRICLWRDADYGLPKATIDAKVPSYSAEGDYPNTAEPVNNSVTSIKNRFADMDVMFYDSINYATQLLCVPQDTPIDNVQSANDRISSHQKGQYC